MNCNSIDSLIKSRENSLGGLISILEEIQSRHGYLPQDALRHVAAETGRSLTDVYGIATFYKAFSLKPRGKHIVSVCLGTACHVRGAQKILEEFRRQLGVAPGDTTPDREFTLETVNCLGACALGPTVVIDGCYFSHVTAPGIKGIIERARRGLKMVDVKSDERIFPLNVACLQCGHSLMDSQYLVDERSSIRINVSSGDTCGWLRLSCLYGSHSIASEHEIPQGSKVSFCCPHCHEELGSAWNCPDCGAPMVQMGVRNGGRIAICSRRGCQNHMLDLTESGI